MLFIFIIRIVVINFKLLTIKKKSLKKLKFHIFVKINNLNIFYFILFNTIKNLYKVFYLFDLKFFSVIIFVFS